MASNPKEEIHKKATPKPDTTGSGKQAENEEEKSFQQIVVQIPAKPPNKSGVKKGIPIETIINLRRAGLTHQQIADTVGCAKATVTQRLRRFPELTDGTLQDYKEARADVLAALQARTLRTLSAEDIANAPVQARAMLFGVLYDKERLERGKSTANLATWCRVVEASAAGEEALMDDD